MIDLEIAWAAGIFEGEGCISTIRVKDRYGTEKYFYPRLQVCMVDIDVIERFGRAIKLGKVGFRKRQSNNHQHQAIWKTTKKGEPAEVIELFWPFLGERRRARAIELGIGLNIPDAP